MIPAPLFSINPSVAADTWPIQRHRRTVHLWKQLLVARYIRPRLANWTEYIFLVRISSSALLFFSSTASNNLVKRSSVLVFSTEASSPTCLLNLPTTTAREGAVIARIPTSSTIWDSAKSLCTICYTVVWNTALRKLLATDRFNTVWITGNIFTYPFHSVARLESSRSGMTALSTKGKILAIGLRTVFFGLNDKSKLNVAYRWGGGLFRNEPVVEDVRRVFALCYHDRSYLFL